MYQPPAFREDRLEIQHALIRAHPLGLLISVGPSGVEANPIPFLLDTKSGELGTLRCHLAKANPQLEALRSAQEVLVVFQGTQNYITPSWYAAKKQHGKTVPTWNYAIVQARGRPNLFEDRDALHAHVSALSDTQESTRPEPWAVTDAPEKFIEAQLKGIVGVEIPIDVIDAKWKVSQNRPESDRPGIVEGLSEINPEMAKLVQHGK